jgi:LmbE family N-acetylglucosaminyl deacetylase
MSRVLVIAAHPDDEVLGPGATVRRFTAAGAEVTVVIVGDGIALRHPGMTLERIRATALKANAELGVTDVRFGGLEADGRLLDELPNRAVTELVRRQIEQVRPDRVLTHSSADINVDHRILADATFYATKNLALTGVAEVLCYEVPSSTEQLPAVRGAMFEPNVFYPAGTYLDDKCRALAHYDTEVFAPPHPRSPAAVRHLAGYRGAQVAAPAAEAFALARAVRTSPSPSPSPSMSTETE